MRRWRRQPATAQPPRPPVNSDGSGDLGADDFFALAKALRDAAERSEDFAQALQIGDAEEAVLAMQLLGPALEHAGVVSVSIRAQLTALEREARKHGA